MSCASTTSRRRRAGTCRRRCSRTSPAAWSATTRCGPTPARSSEYEFVTRVLVDTSKRSTATTLFGSAWSPLRHRAHGHQRAVRLPRRPRAGAGGRARERADDHERLLADPDGGDRAGEPGGLVPGLPAGRRGGDRGADRAREAAGYRTLVVTVDAPVASNRENNIRAGFSTPLRPSAALAWEGLTHPRWLFGTFLRRSPGTACRTSRTTTRARGAPILSANVLRDFSDRGHLSWEHFA